MKFTQILVAPCTAALVLLSGCGGGGGGGEPGTSPTPPVVASECTGANGGGWCWESPITGGSRVRDVRFLPDGRAFAVGDFGALWRSTDNGATWTKLPPLAGRPHLIELRFAPNGRDGWALGADRIGMRTSDGGATWQALPEAPFAAARIDTHSIVVSDALWSVAVNDGEGSLTAFSSRDRGATWQPTNALLMRNGTLHRDDTYSVDGGATWLPVPDGARGGSRVGTGKVLAIRKGDQLWWLPAIGQTWRNWVLPSGAGWLTDVDERVVWTTQSRWDGASNSQSEWIWRWQPIEGQAQSWLLPFWPSDLLVASDRTVGVSVRGFTPSSAGRMTLTADGGATWIDARPAQAAAALNAVQLSEQADGSLLLVMAERDASTVRSPKVLFRSTDGGRSWSAVLGEAVRLPTVVELAARPGGGVLGIDDEAAVWRRPSSGLPWIRTAGLLGPVSSYGSLQFTAADEVWVVNDGILRHSTDGGLSWRGVAGPANVVRAAFLDGTRGFISADDFWTSCTIPQMPHACQGAALSSTTDGAKSWNLVGAGRLSLALSADELILVGPRLSVDGGKTFTTFSPVPGYHVDTALAPSGGALFALFDNALWRSTDRGRSWSTVTLPALDAWRFTGGMFSSIAFGSSQNGWIVGSTGLILATSDGGSSWQVQASGTPNDLYAVVAISATEAWVGGEAGTILATRTGGR